MKLHPHNLLCPRCSYTLNVDGRCTRDPCKWCPTPYQAKLLAAGFQVDENDATNLDARRGHGPPPRHRT